MDILLYLSSAFLFGYTAAILCSLGIPKSLSETYYLLDFRYGNGWLFSLFLGFAVVFLLPFWVELSEGSDFQFLGFLAPASLLFVAVAPRFREEFEGKVHSISALVGAVCSILWVVLVAHRIDIFIYTSSVIGLIGVVFGKWKQSKIFLLEMIAFLTTYISIYLLFR